MKIPEEGAGKRVRASGGKKTANRSPPEHRVRGLNLAATDFLSRS